MTRVTRSTLIQKQDELKENHSINTVIESIPKTPKKRQNQIDDSDCSPPKLNRTVTKSPGISDTLRSTLNIADTNPSARCKYSSARKALSSNENFKLPGRETEIETLKELIDTAYTDKKSCSLYISGQPGTGKTASLMQIMNTKEYQKKFQMAYVNCTSISSIGSIYKRIVEALDLNCHGGTVETFRKCIENHLTTTKKMLMIILDEIDTLSTNTQAVLYRIFEWPARTNSKLILVGIANALDLTDRLLTRLQTKTELKPTLLHFPPYTKTQIIDIFKNRLEDANVLELFPPTTIQLLAAKVAAVSGDIRRALDIGRRVVALAQHGDVQNIQKRVLMDETEETTGEEKKPVQLKEVLSVLNNVYGSTQNHQEDTDTMPIQQKLLVCALLLVKKNEKNREVTVGRLYEVYRKVCTKRNLTVVDFSDFVNLCELIETKGIILLKKEKKKEARLGKVFLQWNEDEINAALRDKQLISTILEDKTCLSR